jgi:4-aminobutyrate aminotransferase-like enzyme
MQRAFARGLSFSVSGDSVIVLSPPLIIGEGEMTAALCILDECLAAEESSTG